MKEQKNEIELMLEDLAEWEKRSLKSLKEMQKN